VKNADKGFKNKIVATPNIIALNAGATIARSAATPTARVTTNSFDRAKPTQKVNPDNITMIGIACKTNAGELNSAKIADCPKSTPFLDRPRMFSSVSITKINRHKTTNTRKNAPKNRFAKYRYSVMRLFHSDI
jgi:hypothetical protein